MPHLDMSLLGTFRVMLDDIPLTRFAADKVRALLAFLAVEADRPHRRESLIDLLWPDRPPAAARSDLRQTLYQLRRTLTTSQGWPRTCGSRPKRFSSIRPAITGWIWLNLRLTSDPAANRFCC